MVGDDETVCRDKRGAAAAKVNDGVERCLGEVGQLLRGELEAEGLHLLGTGRELRGEPHSLLRGGRQRVEAERKKRAERERGAEGFHGELEGLRRGD